MFIMHNYTESNLDKLMNFHWKLKKYQLWYRRSYSSSEKSYKTYDSYDDGYDAIYDDDDYDEDRYDSDPDYAAGVDDAMDELDW